MGSLQKWKIVICHCKWHSASKRVTATGTIGPQIYATTNRPAHAKTAKMAEGQTHGGLGGGQGLVQGH